MIKLRKGYEIVYFEKLTDYYVAVISKNDIQTEFTDKTSGGLKMKIDVFVGDKRFVRSVCIMPPELIDFCQGVGVNQITLDSKRFYHNIMSMAKTNGFVIKSKKIKNHLSLYQFTRLTNN